MYHELNEDVLRKILLTSANEIILHLTNNKKYFTRNIVKINNAEGLMLLLQIFSKACDADCIEQLMAIFKKLLEQNYFRFNENITFSLSSERKVYLYIKRIVQTILKSNAEINLYNILQFINDTDKKLNNTQLGELKSMVMDHMKRKSIENNTSANEITDFRYIRVFPSACDFLLDRRPCLKANIIQGTYKSTFDYLDTHFRLLREDFIGPIRKEIQAYLKNEYSKLFNIKIHEKVELTPVLHKNFHSYTVLLPVRKRSADSHKRFMFGSLVFFINDHKFETMFSAIVVESSLKTLTVAFDHLDVLPTIKENQVYVMIECKTFFTPYNHVLSVLQKMATSMIPMANYIISVKKAVNPPKYLKANRIKINGVEINPYVKSGWPVEFGHLNTAQYSAFKAAIMQEFVIIQGPPGTGKTFLAKKVATTLLQNQNLWYDSTPMLVVCFTNHALDQFLEGLIDETTQLLRIGNQCKSEKLKAFQYKEYKYRNRHRILTSKQYPDFKSLYDSVTTCTKIISECQKNLVYIKEDKGIIKIHMVNGLLEIKEITEMNDIQFVLWLLEDDTVHDASVDGIARYLSALRLDNSLNNRQIERAKLEFLLKKHILRFSNTSALCLKSVHGFIHLLQTTYEHFQIKNDISEDIKNTIELLNSKTKFIKENLAKKNNSRVFSLNYTTKHPATWTSKERWDYYYYFLTWYQKQLANTIEEKENKFRMLHNSINSLRDKEMLSVMKTALVVGMTTTAAARSHDLLEELKSPIIFVEEAAEVLESHVLTALNKNCQHLLLFGDHQQLQPNNADYELTQRYNLGVSLFERMVLNEIQCYQLNVQFRMRPEFSSLIRPAIYKDYQDHKSVFSLPEVKGMLKTLYFINHDKPEEQTFSGSRINRYEAEFILKLAKYLYLNGYKHDEITILTTYKGQASLLEEMIRTVEISAFKQIRISTVDGYQGEESRIILLSLVRNNSNGIIGFLKEDNRICVALSRAKEGMYIMGNINILRNICKTWKAIAKVLQDCNSVGTYITLKCQNHGHHTKIEKLQDFEKVPHGGCNQSCQAILKCGHKCQYFCHVFESIHKGYKCDQTCSRNHCDNKDHVCQKICNEQCAKCCHKVNCTLPCGHQSTKLCYEDIQEIKCQQPVKMMLPCNHEFTRACHEEEKIIECQSLISIKHKICGHVNKLLCFMKESAKCMRTKEIKLMCGHMYNSVCEPDLSKTHKCMQPCQKYKSGCTMSHRCQKLCGEPCEPCTTTVLKRKTSCPHLLKVSCSKDINTVKCRESCVKKLPCGHECTKPCFEECSICVVCQKATF